jgi:tetratricopeptide (TPR) repeat protein
MLISFGEAYPDILINFANIARVHQQNREPTLASGCYIKAIELLTQVYGGKNHVNTSFCYSSLASLYYELGEYRKSADYQGEAVSILQKVSNFLHRSCQLKMGVTLMQ